MKFNLTLSKRSSVLNGIVCYEPVNIITLNKLINSNLLITNWENFEMRDNIGCEKKQLMKYRGLYDNEKQMCKVEYKLCSGMSFGRSNPNGAIGLFAIRRQVRHTLCRDNGLVDWDIVNCHPNILLQICKDNGLACPQLEKYVLSRNDILKRLMDITECSRDRAKQLFIRLLYFGKFENWLKEKKDKDGNIVHKEISIYAFQGHEDFTQYIYDFTDELEKIGERIIEANPKIFKEVEKNKKKKGITQYNEKGSVVSYFLQEYEIMILECIYTYCVENGYIFNNICVLCADGIMLENNLIQDVDIATEFNTVVKAKTGFDLQFENKKMDEYYTDEDFEKSKLSTSLLDTNKLDRFDTDYFHTLSNYELKKMYFENFVFKVLRPDPVYVYIEKDGKLDDMKFYSKTKLSDAFCHLGSSIFSAFGEELKFINVWVCDNNIKLYNKMDFLPINKNKEAQFEKHIFNLFRGFNPSCYGQVDDSKRDKLLKPFMDLGLQLCGGEQNLLDYLLKYLADIFQNPEKKNPIAFIIKGKQGTGKNVWLNAVGNLLGSVHYITSSNPNDFFGEYAEGFYHKLLVNMNECEGKDTFDFEGRIKSFITEDTITLNKKFVCPITISNLARLLIFSNKPNPIPIDVRSKDRRYVVYETTDVYLDKKYGTQFWLKLISHFKREDFVVALYDYFMNINLEGFDWKAERPITTAYRNMCKLYVPTEALFLENFFNSKIQYDLANPKGTNTYVGYENSFQKVGITGHELYKEYMDFTKLFGFNKEGSFQKNIKSFYSSLTTLEVPMTQKKPQNITTFYFSMSEVMNYLKEKKWIDQSDEDLLDLDKEIVDLKGEAFDEYFDV